MTSIKSYKRSTVIKSIEDNLNQINQRYFEGNHGILLVTDSGNYVTIHNRTGNQYFDVQGIFDALNSFSLDGFDDRDYYDIWDYLDFCKYTPEVQEFDNKLKTDDELSFSEKRQVALVDMLLSEPESSGLDDWTISLIPHSPIHTEASTLSELVDELGKENKQLKEEISTLQFGLTGSFDLVQKLSKNVEFLMGMAETKASLEIFKEAETEAQFNVMQERIRRLESRIDDLECQNAILKNRIKELDSHQNDNQESVKYTASETARLNKWIKQLQEEYQELEKNYEILEKKNQELEQSKEFHVSWVDNLKQQIHDLECSVYLLQQENKQLKSNQAETKPETQPEPQPEPKPTTKKRPKFKLPENFADYQQECDDLTNALSCFYNIKKGKWNGNILQFILTPTASQKENYPDKWRAGLYLQPGQWTVDKVSMSDPDDWEDWFMDINDFADSNGIEIS